MAEPRFYREYMQAADLVTFQVQVKETDLFVAAERNLYREALEAVLKYRNDLENFIQGSSFFKTSLAPFEVSDTAPLIVKEMALAAKKVNVGPMAAVAGAVAEFVGKDLLKYSEEVIVENGGDIFLKTLKPRKIAIYAGDSPLSNRIAIEIKPEQTPLGICTSAGTLGHSLSFGKADAVVVLSKSASLADAAATAIGNRVQEADDIEKGIVFAKGIKGISGVVIIKDDKIGIWGEIKIESF